MVLPLKLNAFERYMLTDDRPSHPMVCPVKLVFSGSLDRQAFLQAVDVAVARHPLLAATVAGRSPRQWTWVAADPPRPWIDFDRLDAPLLLPDGQYIDLRRQTGLRIWVRTAPDRSEVHLHVHHACCDGIGAYQFIEDLLCAYDQAVRPESTPVALRPLDPQRLATRTRFGLSPLMRVLRVGHDVWGIVVGLLTFLLPRPRPILSPDPPPSDVPLETAIDMPAAAFTEAETRRLLEAARAQRTSLNDLLIRDTLLALDRWNTAIHSRGRGLLRVMIPTNLRAPDDDVLPAANVVAMVFVDRLPIVIRRPRLLLATIRWEIGFLKFFRLGIAFVRCCQVLVCIPGGMRFLSAAGRCYATTVLSNMGRLFTAAPLPRAGQKLQTGGLVLQHVASAPPVRPFTHAVVSVLSYAGCLSVALNYDRRHFTPRAAEQLLDALLAQFRRSAGLADSPHASPAEPSPATAASSPP